MASSSPGRLSLLVLLAVVAPWSARAEAPLVDGLGGRAGYGTQVLDASTAQCAGCTEGDDGASGPIDLSVAFPGGLHVWGRTHLEAYVDINGAVTLGAAAQAFDPGPFPASAVSLVAPFRADVDVRAPSVTFDNTIYWHLDEEGGRLIATWNEVGAYNRRMDLANSFQVVVTTRHEVAEGDFDVEFRYARCEWAVSDAPAGPGESELAQVGFDAGDGRRQATLDLPDATAVLSLCDGPHRDVAGVWRFQVRSGVVSSPDLDGDRVFPPSDNCPMTPNPAQGDNDGDGQGDACDDDDDEDGVSDATDNCPDARNRRQIDFDKDGVGDVCDSDLDGDGAPNADDNCPLVPNADQADVCGDGDGDGDCVDDDEDNCADLYNPIQADSDGDGQGDLCDDDVDGDALDDSADPCPYRAGADADCVADGDGDGDGVADVADLCPRVVDPEQGDADFDGLGDACDADADDNGLVDACEGPPAVPGDGGDGGDGGGAVDEDREDPCPTGSTGSSGDCESAEGSGTGGGNAAPDDEPLPDFAITGGGPRCQAAGTSAFGGASGAGLLLLLALLLGSRRRRWVGAAALATLCTPAAWAQQGFRLEQFDPAANPRSDYLAASGARTLRPGESAGSIWLSYADNLLMAQDPGSDSAWAAIVEDQLVGRAVVALGVDERLELAVDIPFLIHQTSGDLAFAGRPGEALGASGVGDIRVAPKARLYGGEEPSGLGVALSLNVNLPSGSAADFTSDGRLSFEPRILGDWRLREGFGVATAVGFNSRPSAALENLHVGNEWTFQLALEAPLSPSLSVLAELDGSLVVGEASRDREESPLEGRGALRARLDDHWTATAGAGAGIVNGFGVPDVRAFAGVGWSPHLDPDPDGDGLDMDSDACPRVAEDVDGWRDDDGCPEEDDDPDGDGVLGARDACPQRAEDVDGWKDGDGCPEADDDGDGDGVVGASDGCPTQAEDMDGWQDADGCPEVDDDPDGDGVLDLADRCPLKPEDKDGWEDADGCPETDDDPDGDRIYGSGDACPLEAEDFDGVDDHDGCPDPEVPGAAPPPAN